MITGLLERIIGSPAPQALNPNEERFWNPNLPFSVAGVRVDAETAMKVGTVYACVGRIATTMASLPLLLLRALPGGGKERATDLVLYQMLKAQPNRWQTSFEWREMMFGHALLRGNGYSEIIKDDRLFPEQLIPINPTRVKAELMPDGRVSYKVRRDDGTDRIIPQERIFHLRGLGSDGITGLSVVSLANVAIGGAIAAEQYAARFYNQTSAPAGVIKHPNVLGKEGRDNLKTSWQEAQGGLPGAHSTAILEEGMEWQAIGMSHEDSQFLETRHFQVSDIARWFNVPLMLLQEMEKSTSWGTGIESLQVAFVTYSLRPWAVRFEQTLQRDVIVAQTSLFAEFLFDALLRGTTKERFEAFAIARQNGWFNSDEIREFENMNPLPNGEGKIYWRPANMVPADTPVGMIGAGRGNAAEAQVRALAHEAAGRLVRKEITAVQKAAQKHADEIELWVHWLHDFYAAHWVTIERDLHIGEEAARAYCESHADTLKEHGARCAEGAEQDWTDDLATLALGGD